MHYHSVSSRPPRLRRVAHRLLPLTGLLVLVLAGCGFSPHTESALEKVQTLTFPYVNATAVQNPSEHVAVFDPAVVTLYIDSTTVDMLYSGLVTLDSATLTVTPDAASSWALDSTGTVYTFKLRPNLFFSDGNPISAQDFAYSLDRTLANNNGVCKVDDAATYGQNASHCIALGSAYLGLILGAAAKGNSALSGTQSVNMDLIGPGKGLEVVDTHTLIIRLAHPAAYFLEALSDPVADPVERTLVDKFHGGTWVDHLNQGGCSGPFMVKSYTPGADLKLVPNPYWRGRKLTLTEVDRPFLASQDTEYNRYDKLGDYDYTDVPGDTYVFAVGQSDFHQIASLVTDYFGLNFNLPPFTDTRIRQAFDLALNKQLLADRIFDGGGIPTNHIVPEGMPGYDPLLTGPDGTESVTGNQQKALALLQEAKQDCRTGGDTQSYCPYIDAGTADKAIVLVAGASTDATHKEIALIASQTWKQVLGLNVQVQDAGDLSGVIGVISPPNSPGPQANPAQLWQLGWLADYPDAEDFLSLQFHTGSGINFSNVQDTQLDAQMDRADTDFNASRRTAEYNTIEQEVVDMCAWIPFVQLKFSWRLRPWVQGFGLNELLIMQDIDWPNVSILAH